MKDQARRGFTLIEMVVSIGIIAMVTSLFIANYHFASKRSDLTMTAQELVADLHAAQNKTLGLAKYNGAVPAGGWGIHFDLEDNSYTLFADGNEPGTGGYGEYDPLEEGNGDYGARLVPLSETIRITELKSADNQTHSLADVTFLPPDPTTNIWVNGGATSTTLEITLSETDNNSLKTIRVNFLGLAEVID